MSTLWSSHKVVVLGPRGDTLVGLSFRFGFVQTPRSRLIESRRQARF
ncbi:MAG: hypothetical protein WCK86_04800 [Planctomycetia bacterium]